MKKRILQRNRKVRRLRESYEDEVESSMYSDWFEFIRQFGAETTAKLLASAKANLEDIIASYSDEYQRTSRDVITALSEKARSLGLSNDATDIYEWCAYTQFDAFLCDKNSDSSYLKVAYDADLVDEVKDALLDKTYIYLVIREADEDEDVLSWDDALDALREQFNVVSTGETDDGGSWAIVTDKQLSEACVSESARVTLTLGQIKRLIRESRNK